LNDIAKKHGRRGKEERRLNAEGKAIDLVVVSGTNQLRCAARH
jgi:hypothetical protein